MPLFAALLPQFTVADELLAHVTTPLELLTQVTSVKLNVMLFTIQFFPLQLDAR